MKLNKKYFLTVACAACLWQTAQAQQPGPATQLVTFGIHYAHSLALAEPFLAPVLLKGQASTESSLQVTVPATRPQKITAALGSGASAETRISMKLQLARKVLSTVPKEVFATETNVMSQKFGYSYLSEIQAPSSAPTHVIFTITD